MSDCGAAKVISRGMNYDFNPTLSPPLGTSPTLHQASKPFSELLGIRSYSADACCTFARIRMIRPG
jgi:hypothetical protein